MPFTIKATTLAEYTILEAQGSLESLEEYLKLNDQYILMAYEANNSNVLVDERALTLPQSITLQSSAIENMVKELPENMRMWKLALVDSEEYYNYSSMFTTNMQKHNLTAKTFTSIVDGIDFFKEN